MNFRIVVDSTSDIPDDYIKKYNIKVVPLKVIIGDKTYRDRIDITDKEIWRLMSEEGAMPKTSAPSVEDFISVYKELEREGADGIVSIHLSGKLSATVNVAKMASKEVKIPVISFDSKSVSLGYGFLAIEIAKLIEKGVESLEEIKKKLEEFREKLHVFLVVRKLDYLIRGGRLTRVEGIVGKMLKISPVIKITKEGTLSPFSFTRGYLNALKKIERYLKTLVNDKVVNFAVMHAMEESFGKNSFNRLKTSLKTNLSIFGSLSSVLTAHAGPGTIGIGVLEIDQ